MLLIWFVAGLINFPKWRLFSHDAHWWVISPCSCLNLWDFHCIIFSPFFSEEGSARTALVGTCFYHKVIWGIVFQQIPFFFCSIPIVNPNPSMLCRMPRKAWQKRLEDRIIQILWLSHLYCRPERDVLIFHWCGWKLPNLLSQCATVYTHFAGISVVLFLLCSPKCPDLWKAHYLVLKWSLALRKKAL